MNTLSIKTLKVRVRDGHIFSLNQQGKSVNFVWNFLNETSHRFIKERGKFMSAFDLQKYTDGAGKELGLHSHTIQEVGKEYVTRKKQFKKAKLKWRKSHGVKRSLGWIPFKSGALKWKNGSIYFNGQYFRVWDSYGLAHYTLKSGSFNEDSRGRWYLNIVVSFEAEQGQGKHAVGIDLGCKQSTTDSNGHKVIGREYRKLESKLGLAQRANNKKRVKAIHSKIKSRRADTLHKYSRKLVNENAAIFVGNVSSQKLVKTNMAKSVLDASWGTLKAMLEYKCAHANIVFKEVNEAYTTQTCSCCGEIPISSPKGRAGLGIRGWTCSVCHTTHDRDINSGKNILAVGLHRLAEGKVAGHPP